MVTDGFITAIEQQADGAFALLEAARHAWSTTNAAIRDDVLFHHVSTDEVFGSLGATGYFT